ncbi:anhydro-N-acetylmuramic acid kinase [Labrenzia sp. THAF82]|uniref:GNAT family N-acetyltransferase n=1 Tax=Labrenzia sp. THAF82 TaxID=2587861 RepID=UPI001268D1EF|nr:GNAT family N-acetyltransferase [Labrenzia sp. THAF82]QFT34583.1 anhydro-N-acetylmuramic acid kinase [Labrenzia sp. THAF82]
MIVFETSRLKVRKWRRNDFDTLLSVYGNQKVCRYIDDGSPLSADEARAWLSVTQTNYEKRGYGMWALTAKDTSATIGFGGLVHPGNQKTPEIKYALDVDHWRQGYATEFVSAACSHGFDRFALPSIIATVAAENFASIHVLEKCGFSATGDQLESDGSITLVFQKTAI